MGTLTLVIFYGVVPLLAAGVILAVLASMLTDRRKVG